MSIVANRPRTTREYETVFILRPDILEEDKTKVLDRIQGIMDRLSGHILKSEEWGKRKLAYRIKKNSHGLYYYYRYLGFSDLVGELERNMRILDPVLKYMTLKLEDDVDPEARKAQALNEPSRAPKDEAADTGSNDADEDGDDLNDAED
ncbi:MAG: 30S ribosomal protein S6 [Myxococcota bacterium]|jgi:small subunit ribosomal protein S6|nr:30S ribosomal protein S6 [Myxococcota bacterium]